MFPVYIFNVLSSYCGQSLPWMRWTCSFTSEDKRWQVGSCPSSSKAAPESSRNIPRAMWANKGPLQHRIKSHADTLSIVQQQARQTYLSALPNTSQTAVLLLQITTPPGLQSVLLLGQILFFWIYCSHLSSSCSCSLTQHFLVLQEKQGAYTAS